MAVQNLANTFVAIKKQGALDTPATGSDAVGIEVLPSQGLALQIATIESQMLRRNRMRKKPRHGSRSATASYETELVVGALDSVFEGVLGGTFEDALTFDETDWGALTISGSGTVLTFASGTLLVDGIVAGMMARLTGMSVTSNDNKWFPILSVTGTVMTIPSGILADNASDAAWDIEIARYLYTDTPYTDGLYTIEEGNSDIDRSKLGSDMRFNSLNFDAQPDQPIKIGFGLAGRNMTPLASGDSPHFTSPVFVTGESLVLLDGGLYVNGVKRNNITGFQFGLSAPVSTTAVVGSKIGPDVSIGQFAMTGNFSVVVEDFDDFDAFNDEDVISIFLHCAENTDDPAEFVSFYIGNASYANYTTPVGGEGTAIAQIPLYAGSDIRGAGYADTSVLISTSAAAA